MSTGLERQLQRDRMIVTLGLVGVAALGWLYVVRLSRGMADMAMAMPRMTPWGPIDFVLTFLMWAVMMLAMMVPAATPMILIFAAVNRKRLAVRTPVIRTGLFLGGYLFVWTGYSLLAALAQWGLHTAALISEPALAAAPWLGGLLLIAAGAYQFTPFKDACLSRCQSPLGFILTHWREGAVGAVVMGVAHGAFCVGCCWMMMALLFVAGVMNLLWVAAIAAFVLLEKVASQGRAWSRVAGALFIVWGAWLLTRAT